MKDIINTVLRRNKPLYVTRQKVDSFLTFELIEFMDNKNRYCQMFIGYNATNIYCVHKNLLYSNRGPLTDIINSAIARWDTKEEFIANRLVLSDKKYFDYVGDAFKDSIVNKLIHISVGEYACRKVTVTTNPVATIIVHYNKSNRRQHTLKAFLGDTLYIKYRDEDFKLFVNKCLEDYCYIEWLY